MPNSSKRSLHTHPDPHTNALTNLLFIQKAPFLSLSLSLTNTHVPYLPHIYSHSDPYTNTNLLCHYQTFSFFSPSCSLFFSLSLSASLSDSLFTRKLYLLYTLSLASSTHSLVTLTLLDISKHPRILTLSYHQIFLFKNVNVNVSVSSLKSPLSSADFTIYASGIGTLSYTVSSPLGRIQHLRTLLQL